MQNNNKKTKTGKGYYPKNKGNNRQQHANNKKNKKKEFVYEGFKNRIKLKRIDPTGHTDEFLKDYFSYFGDENFRKNSIDDYWGDHPVHDDVIKFRRNLFNGYHLYKILVSVENHFIGGYTYRNVGWVVGHIGNCRDVINMTIVLDENLVDFETEKLHNIVFFKTLTLASELFMKSGKIVRIMIKKDIYEKQKKFLNNAWKVDSNQLFVDIFGNEIDLNDKNLNLDYVVLKNSSSAMSIKVGEGIDMDLLNFLSARDERIYGIKAVPFVGINLLEKRSNSLVGEHEVCFATINKCNDKKEIHYRCAEQDRKEVEDIIVDGIFYENSFYKHPFDDASEISFVYDGDVEKSST